MRWFVTSILLLPLAASACFEDAPPGTTSGPAASSEGECTAGTEGCACIEGSCIDGLTCLSNTCVDPGADSGGTTSNPPMTADSTSSGGASTSIDTMPETDEDAVDSGPLTTNGGSLPKGALCDPIDDECEPGLSCVGFAKDGIACDLPGPASQGEPCDVSSCGPGLVCIVEDAFNDCLPANGCCTEFCDLLGPETCPADLFCDPFYPSGASPPGYDHVGICVANP